MARPPSPKHANQPLRLLRGLLSKRGKEHPITLGEFQKITGIPANTVKGIENAQRPLSDVILFQVLLGTGAVWDDARKEWLCAERSSASGLPFTREFFLEFRRHASERPAADDASAQVLATKLRLLFANVSDRQWFRLLFWVDCFLEQCRKDFNVEGVEEAFKKMRAGFWVVLDDSGKVLQVNNQYPHGFLEAQSQALLEVQRKRRPPTIRITREPPVTHLTATATTTISGEAKLEGGTLAPADEAPKGEPKGKPRRKAAKR